MHVRGSKMSGKLRLQVDHLRPGHRKRSPLLPCDLWVLGTGYRIVHKSFWNKKMKQKSLKVASKPHQNIPRTYFSTYPKIIGALDQCPVPQSMDKKNTLRTSDL